MTARAFEDVIRKDHVQKRNCKYFYERAGKGFPAFFYIFSYLLSKCEHYFFKFLIFMRIFKTVILLTFIYFYYIIYVG